MKNLKVLVIIVAVIVLLDFVTAPDPLATFEEAFALTMFAYAVKGVFGADPYALAGMMEYFSLLLWLFGSIFWNLYIVHNFSDQSAAYTAAIVAFFVPALVSALGTLVAGVVIETARRIYRSF